MEQTFTFFMFMLTFVPVLIAMVFMPYLTRKTESFGVSIPEDVYHSDELTNMRKQYAIVTGIWGGIVILGVSIAFRYIQSNETFAIVFSGTLLLFILSSFAIYLYYHRQMKGLKASKRWHQEKPQRVTVETRFRDKKLTLSNRWFVIPFLIALGTLLMTFIGYDQIPEKLPMQYDLDGHVINWGEKSYRTMLMFPVLQLFMTVLFLFINTIIAKSKQQLNAANPEKSIQQNVVFRRRWSGFILVVGTSLTLLFFLTQLSFIVPFHPQLLTIIPIVFGLGVTIAAIVLSFTTGQGGSRIKVTTGKHGEVIDRDDDRYWKLGQFYVNPGDPAMFVEKRFGVGWTINFARPLAWSILLLIVLLAIGIPVIFSGQ